MVVFHMRVWRGFLITKNAISAVKEATNIPIVRLEEAGTVSVTLTVTLNVLAAPDWNERLYSMPIGELPPPIALKTHISVPIPPITGGDGGIN
jgi:hypothetical protein